MNIDQHLNTYARKVLAKYPHVFYIVEKYSILFYEVLTSPKEIQEPIIVIWLGEKN